MPGRFRDRRWRARPRVDTAPFYEPPAEITGTSRAERFPFALLTPKTHFFLNRTFASQNRQREAQGAPFVVVHPDDASAAGIVDGQTIRVRNERGAVFAVARVNEDTRPGVLVAPVGRWASDHPDNLGPQATTPQRLTMIGHAPTVNDNRVDFEPA